MLCFIVGRIIISGQSSQCDLPDSPIAQKTSCTDIICLLIFLVFLTSWLALVVMSLKSLTLSRLLRPTNSLVSLPYLVSG